MRLDARAGDSLVYRGRSSFIQKSTGGVSFKASRPRIKGKDLARAYFQQPRYEARLQTYKAHGVPQLFLSLDWVPTLVINDVALVLFGRPQKTKHRLLRCLDGHNGIAPPIQH